MHDCPDCGRACTCGGDIDDIDTGNEHVEDCECDCLEEWEDPDEWDDGSDDFEGCWRCHGDGGWHDCGEDSCCCLDPDDSTSEDWIVCPKCKGRG